MRKRNHSRQAARRRQRSSHVTTLKSLYRRPLRYEPLEDRRLLALVTVNTLSDVTNLSDNLTTLREAIFATNLVGGADTIDFAPALTANGPTTILLTQGELKITDALTLTGPGANLLTIDARGSDPTPNLNNGDGSRVFNIDDGNLTNFSLVSLRGLTLTGGDTNSGGGAILSRERLLIERNVIRDNTTIGPGGGILARFGEVYITGSTLSGNVATSHGGGIYHRGDFQNQFAKLTITDSTISGNTSGGNGGGVFTFHSDSSVTASTVSGNSAVEGGGLFENGRSLHIEDTTVSGNHSSGAGGGIRKTGEGSLLIGSSTIGNNTAGTHGGGVSLGSGGGGSISNSDVRGNTANGRGGGIASEGTLSLFSSSIVGNRATTSGGGIAILAGTAKLGSVQLSFNSSQEGGGLDIRGVGTNVTVQASTIEGNKASNSGGGIHNRATVSLTDSTMRNNVATVAGGGLAALAANTTIFASTISDNTAPLGAGIAGVASANVFTITNSTISSNFATDHAAGIFSGGRLTLKHSTVTGNLAARLVGGIGVYGPTEIGHTIVAGNTLAGGTPNDLRGNTTVAFSLLGVDTGATITNHGGNLLGTAAAPIDPKLGPLADNGGPTQTHALLAGSPAINAGDLNRVAGVGGVPTFDQREGKFSRIFNGRIDIGAFEYQAASDLNLVVDTLVDESDGNYGRGDLSLREATELASKWSSINTIRFDPALTASGPATILLSRGSLQVFGSTTIIGPGMNLLTIDGSGNDPTPDVDDGKGQSVFAITGRILDSYVVMSGLTITGGDSTSDGGGISAVVGSLMLNQMIITGNASGSGGGIEMSQGALILNDSTVAANNSSHDFRGGGGGIYVSNGQLTIASSTISGNTATSLGGGIYFSDSSPSTTNQLLIHDSTISHNSADRGGGGILAGVNVGTVTLVDNLIEGNRAMGFSGGGGLYISALNAMPTTITRNTIRENSAAFGGGAQFQMLGSELLLDQCTVSENSATSPKGSGGGISIVGQSAHGGQSARATIRSSTISANTATGISGGGGGVAVSGAILGIESSTITGNSAAAGGGGIRSYSSLEVVDSEISNNRVIGPNSRGGGIALLRGSLLSISDSTISGNSSAGSGGGLYVNPWNGVQVTITRSHVLRNTAVLDGGGIYHHIIMASPLALSNPLNIVDSTIIENTSGRDGGGINVSVAGGAAKISGTAIAGNTAGRSGGGIAKHGTGSLNLWQSTISNNSAVANGGGIMADDGNPWLDSSTVSGNSAGAQGGGLWTAKAADLRYSTIAQNSAVGAGGGIFASSGSLTLTHTIVASNTAPAGRDLTGLIGTVISPSYSLIGSNAASGLTPAPIGFPDANGNLIGGETSATIIASQLGPLADNGGFTLPDGSHILTHALLPGSPAINAGDLNLKAGVDGVPAFDERGTGFSRVANGRIDIGAFEYQAASDLNLLVDTLVDESDGDCSRGDLSLREAIELANLWPSVDTIHFDPALTATGPATILLTMKQLTVTDSVSINGPGANLLTIDASGNDPTPTIDDGRGSTVFVVRRDTLLNGLTLTGGDTWTDGGAISGIGNLVVTDCVIVDNFTTDRGGAIFAGHPTSSLTLLHSTIVGNRSRERGGGIHSTGGSLIIEDSVISDNTAMDDGGGIATFDVDQVHVRRSTIRNNAAKTYQGGGIYIGKIGDSSTEVTIEDSLISGNSSGAGGGGIYIADHNAIVTNCVINNNTAHASGGGMLSLGNLTVTRCSFLSNNTTTSTGGGIATFGQRTARLIECTISGNIAGQGGGLVNGTQLIMRGCTISGNTATILGGGMTSGRTLTTGNLTANLIENSTISGNNAPIGAGASISDLVMFRHSTIAFNRSSGIAKGIYVQGGALELDHTIVAANIGNTGDINALLGSTVTAHYSIVGYNQGSGLPASPSGPDANGNWIGSRYANEIDPMLGPLTNNGGPTLTHIPRPYYSPAVDGGDPSAVAGSKGVPEFDQRGAAFGRVVGGRIDIGAVEYQPNPLAGDYNFDGKVDAADYIVWRKTKDSFLDLQADGNSDAQVNDADRIVWQANFGETATPTAVGTSSNKMAGTSAFAEVSMRATPARRSAFAAARPSSFRPSVADHLLATVAASRAAPAQRAVITEVAVTTASRDNFAPARRNLLSVVDEAFATFAVPGV